MTIKKIVDVFSLNKDELEKRINELENNINDLVVDLYGLSEEEMNIVKSNVKK